MIMLGYIREISRKVRGKITHGGWRQAENEVAVPGSRRAVGE